MRRGMYIALAVVGVMLVVASAVAALVAPVPPGNAAAVAVAEVVAAAVGIGLAWAGLMQARLAGDYDVRIRRGPRRRGGAPPTTPAVGELSFDCPGCGRTYRASQQAAGLPFACRACEARFNVPRPTA